MRRDSRRCNDPFYIAADIVLCDPLFWSTSADAMQINTQLTGKLTNSWGGMGLYHVRIIYR